MVVHAAHLPKPGETILGGEFRTVAGGKGANQAVAAARLGAKVTLIARIGRDDLGDRALAGLQREHINVDHVSRDREARSGVALITVADDGENSITVAPGANASMKPVHVRRAHRAFSGCGPLLVQLETPIDTVTAAVELARRSGMPVILNPAPAQRLPESLLRKVSILTPNETEAELLTGIRVADDASAAQAAEALRASGIATVIITMGARGAFVVAADGARLVPGFKVKTLDTTAAGDVFNAALATALAEGKLLQDAVIFANAAAALSVTRAGAQPSAPRRAEVERLLKSASRQGAMAAAPGRRGSGAPKK
jgi:ribokinase